MDVGYYPFQVLAGSDFAEPIFYQNEDGTPVNLTGYTAALQVRRTTASPTPALSLATGTGLTLTPLEGKILVTITQEQGRALCLDNARTTYLYDLEITSPGSLVTRILEGRLVVLPEVTR